MRNAGTVVFRRAYTDGVSVSMGVKPRSFGAVVAAGVVGVGVGLFAGAAFTSARSTMRSAGSVLSATGARERTGLYCTLFDPREILSNPIVNRARPESVVVTVKEAIQLENDVQGEHAVLRHLNMDAGEGTSMEVTTDRIGPRLKVGPIERMGDGIEVHGNLSVFMLSLWFPRDFAVRLDPGQAFVTCGSESTGSAGCAIIRPLRSFDDFPPGTVGSPSWAGPRSW